MVGSRKICSGSAKILKNDRLGDILENEKGRGDGTMSYLGLEVRAFGKLYFLFKERGWDNPREVRLASPVTADELREELEIPAGDVEAVFINHSICPFSTVLQDGDRVAFVPPGVPTIHRFMLGFYGTKGE